MPDLDLRGEDVWAKKAHDLAGSYLGVAEGGRLDGERLIFPAAEWGCLPHARLIH